MATGEFRGPDLRVMQKERDRERRRLRDRQRRQSMSLEERAKHLARRRRNYQLRRQKAGGYPLVSLHKTSSFIAMGVPNTMDQNPNLIAACGQVGLNKTEDNLDASGTECKVKDPESVKIGMAPRRLSIKQIRNLARMLNASVDKQGGGNDLIRGDETQNGRAVRNYYGRSRSIEGSFSVPYITTKQVGDCISGVSRTSIRLIHVKRLARALNSTMVKTANQNKALGSTPS